MCLYTRARAKIREGLGDGKGQGRQIPREWTEVHVSARLKAMLLGRNNNFHSVRARAHWHGGSKAHRKEGTSSGSLIALHCMVCIFSNAFHRFVGLGWMGYMMVRFCFLLLLPKKNVHHAIGDAHSAESAFVVLMAAGAGETKGRHHWRALDDTNNVANVWGPLM